MTRPHCLPSILAALVAAVPSYAIAADAAGAAPSLLRWEWNARLRQESVDDDAFARNADATTLRLRAGLRLQSGSGFNALLEGEGIAATGGYNSGANGGTTRPTILDPRGIELNQAFAGWRNETFAATIGRQRLAFDNQRWIGNSGWRQNEQTFDAAAVEWKFARGWNARYAWLGRVHRVAGDDALDPLARERALDTHLGELAWKRGAVSASGYAWLHRDRDLATASTRTLGLRAVVDPAQDGGFGLAMEVARQQEHADNPLRFSHAYWLLEPAWTVRGTTLRAGWEHLGGDGAHALQAPLGTLHAFNGWADKFNATPPAGLDDRYLGAGGAFGRARAGGRATWQLAWHDYRADRGAAHYGSEWNASLVFPLAKGVAATIKFADYRADAFARDTRKVWLQLEYAGSR
jgi:hypothetical protein